MLELGIVLLIAFGALWLFGALIGGLFKLTFGIIGVMFGGVFGIFALALAAIVVLPIMLLALLPLLLPALCIAAVVWLVVRASRSDHPTPTVH